MSCQYNVTTDGCAWDKSLIFGCHDDGKNEEEKESEEEWRYYLVQGESDFCWDELLFKALRQLRLMIFCLSM